jgi:hypothetical protein
VLMAPRRHKLPVRVDHTSDCCTALRIAAL